MKTTSRKKDDSEPLAVQRRAMLTMDGEWDPLRGALHIDTDKNVHHTKPFRGVEQTDVVEQTEVEKQTDIFPLLLFRAFPFSPLPSSVEHLSGICAQAEKTTK